MLRTLFLGGVVVLGVALSNGVFMLGSPETWYLLVPGVTTTGPLNQHFVRDIGLIFLFVGTAFLAGVGLPRYGVVLWATPMLPVQREQGNLSQSAGPSASSVAEPSRLHDTAARNVRDHGLATSGATAVGKAVSRRQT